ncbi:hypothetical protein SBRCBS47491_001704 [Sporothrix bragantina]|uniref:37S ribosomal protein S12 n=1 Tax=Sporothrix bragantina TaxID=671064 RepID=A0ABP0B0V7_9PEZI
MQTSMVSPLLRLLLRPAMPLRSQFAATTTTSSPAMSIASRLPMATAFRSFSSTPVPQATLNQVLRGCRKPQRARHAVSPALSDKKAPMMKGVCLKVGITRPKKPNSGERKTARIRLSNGRMITAYIPGEGHNIQQHSVVLVRGGRAQDCPGVRYRLIRGALDLGGVTNRMTSRSKFGAKKPKTASVG